EDDDPPVREVPTRLPPDEVERAGHGAVDGQRDDQAGPVGEDAKQRKREPRIVLHVVAPDHVPRREHARGEALGRERQRRLREELEGVLGRSEEHTSELQSLAYLVCRLLLEKKKKKRNNI